MEGIEWGSYWALALPVSYSDSGRSIFLNPLEDVYLGRDIKTGQDVALKLEPIEMRSPRLSHEYTVYKALSDVSGVPTIHWYGREVPYNVMVLDRLGLTLEEAISKRHDINLVFLYATQMVGILHLFYTPGHSAHIPTYSSPVLNRYTSEATSIEMSNPQTS